MAVNEIIIPNYDETLSLLKNKKIEIKSGAPPSILDILNYDGPCIVFKGSPDCKTIYFEDHTVYPSGRLGSKYTFEMSVSLVYRTVCGDESAFDGSVSVNNNGRTSFHTENGDGKYCALVTMTITDNSKTPVVFVNEYEYCVEMYCCQNKVICLGEEIADCMAAVSCKISTYKNIGRNFTKLTSKYLKMSNLLWVINNRVIDCDSYNSLACLFKKI
jgi:hypothetical protein